MYIYILIINIQCIYIYHYIIYDCNFPWWLDHLHRDPWFHCLSLSIKGLAQFDIPFWLCRVQTSFCLLLRRPGFANFLRQIQMFPGYYRIFS